MMLPVIVIGAGGHAKVVLDALLAAGIEVLGLVDADPMRQNGTVLGVPVIGGDARLADFGPARIRLAVGIGGGEIPAARRDIFERYRSQGYGFVTAVHPAAVAGREVSLGEGAQVLAGAVINPGTVIGENAIVNTRAVVEHDCRVGAHVHVAPGAILAGGVEVGEEALIGAGAVVAPGRRVGRRCIVGAGAVLVRDLAAGLTAGGVPARELIGRKR